MKKKIQSISLVILFISSLISIGCNDDKDYELGQITVPTSTTVTATPSTDGTGLTSFEVNGDNVITYKVDFGDGSTGYYQSRTFTKSYGTSGTYIVTVTPYGTAGASGDAVSTTFTIEVDFTVPDGFIQNLTGGSSKTWYWDAATAGYLGVGPGDNPEPIWYTSDPYTHEGAGCLFDDTFIFTYDATTGSDVVTYEYQNNGVSYYNADFSSTGSDNCENVDTSGVYNVGLGKASDSVVPTSTGVSLTISGSGSGNFMGYYANGSGDFEVLELTASTLYVRWIDSAGRAWYQKFTTVEPGSGGSGGAECASGATGATPEGAYTLVWSDEFNVDGSPCPENWSYDIGTGENGWGNGEAQYYTDREDNAIVENGVLKIIAKKEEYQGSTYTSARLKTQDIFEFQYGRVDVRAKLPEGGGTWPAIWMLGANFDTVGWPACGEIDIMEHVGNNPGTILGTVHYPGNSGGAGPTGTTVIDDPSTFHLYSVEWDENAITFSVDGSPVGFFTVENNSTLPFNQDFFLILNTAMGGGLGGNIDSSFTESTMEIDFVRVFKK